MMRVAFLLYCVLAWGSFERQAIGKLPLTLLLFCPEP